MSRRLSISIATVYPKFALGQRDLTRARDSPDKPALQEEDLGEEQFSANVDTDPKGGKRRLFLFGHFGMTSSNNFGNFGNEGTLLAILHHLRRLLPGFELNAICTGPAATTATHNITALPISRPILETWMPSNRVARAFRSILIGVPCELYRWVSALMTLKGTDVLIVPGTGLITDACGLRGWGPYSLFKWSVVAKIRGCKLLFLSVGAGPLYSRLGRFFVKSALALADFRSYRDESSMEYLRSIGFARPEDPVCPDLAFSLPLTSIPDNGDERRARPVVGLGLMLYAGKYSAENPTAATFRNYLDALAGFVNWLLTREYDIRLLIGDLCDRPVTQEFSNLLKERLSVYDAIRVVEERVDSVGELLLQLRRTDVVVATRFHNILLALLSNKPVIAISFHHKCSSLMGQMGLAEYSQDINTLRADQLIEQFGRLVKNAGALKAMIAEKVKGRSDALDEQYKTILQVIWPERDRVPAVEMHKAPN